MVNRQNQLPFFLYKNQKRNENKNTKQEIVGKQRK
jgi:hypothetical protein